MRLVFMGTPEFALPALRALHASQHSVAAVYTQPPRPAGRGQEETPSPVHRLAISLGIPVHTPATLKSPEIQEQFRALNADVAVVVAYGLLLPRAILDAPAHGCLNIHPSSLPRWRGAAPIQRTLMAGDSETSVCIMRLDEGMDTGDILLEQPLSIPPTMNAGDLHDKTAELGANLLIETLIGLQQGTIIPRKQSADGICIAPKIRKEEARIDWTQSAQTIHNLIRGLSPKPGVFFMHGGQPIKILRADYDAAPVSTKPATVMDDALTIACGSGVLRPQLLQRSGKTVVSAADLLRGYPLPAGTILE